MKNIFSTDSKFYTIPAKIVDVLWLSILWIVCSIPIITIGASSCAMFYVTLKMCRDEEGGVTKQFFKAFKANFKQGTILWLIMLVVGIILGVNLVVCRQNETTFGIVLFMITTVLILWYLMELLYLFPVVARFENTVKRQLVFAFLLATAHPFRTILMIAIFAGAVILIFFVPIGLAIAIAIYTYLTSLIILPIFEKGIKKEE